MGPAVLLQRLIHPLYFQGLLFQEGVFSVQGYPCEWFESFPHNKRPSGIGQAAPVVFDGYFVSDACLVFSPVGWFQVGVGHVFEGVEVHFGDHGDEFVFDGLGFEFLGGEDFGGEGGRGGGGGELLGFEDLGFVEVGGEVPVGGCSGELELAFEGGGGELGGAMGEGGRGLGLGLLFLGFFAGGLGFSWGWGGLNFVCLHCYLICYNVHLHPALHALDFFLYLPFLLHFHF